MNTKASLSLLIALLPTTALGTNVAQPFDAVTFENVRETKAVVLVHADWGEYARCGPLHLVRLRGLTFARSDLSGGNADANEADTRADLVIDAKSVPEIQAYGFDHAFTVEPGEYEFRSFRIDSAPVGSDVIGYTNHGRTPQDRRPQSATFAVAAGEIIYIGRVRLRCAGAKESWKEPVEPVFTYPYDAQAVEWVQQRVHLAYPLLSIEEMKVRFVKTAAVGRPFRVMK